MQLIVITDENEITSEARIVNELFAIGLQRLHLRKPRFSTEEYSAYINSIDAQYHSRIVVHGGFELVNELKLGGAHLNSAMRTDKTVWEMINMLPASRISTSFHSWEEITENEFRYHYVFISPVFDSISKKGYNAAIDLGGAFKTKNILTQAGRDCPELVGLGGVGIQNIKVLEEYGFDGAAVLGSMWTSADPVRSFSEMQRITNSRTNC